MNNIIFMNNDIKITSLELLEIINSFREMEDKKPKEHKNLLRDIKKEIEILETLNINQLNFEPVNYIDNKGEKRPCYSINRDGMLMLLNKESTLVRYKTSEYIKNLEKAYLDLKFKQGDKKHQIECMGLLQKYLPEELKKENISYIKANTIVNKIVSTMFGFEKMVKKADMSIPMLEVREQVLEDYLKLFEVLEDNHLTKEALNKKYDKKMLKGAE